uniref:Amine oxidase domain-containing protein n=1 Tax=viral metagenome TaxID=1070528 RepID=A0A6C0I5N8_9ZZZZ
MTTIIIGGGIAGLYSAYQLKLANQPFLLLEKEATVGGRMGSPLFHGVHVAKGAGIGRKKKDKLLQALVKDLGIETHEFKATHQYVGSQLCDVKSIFQDLKTRWTNDRECDGLTFKEFAQPILGPVIYKQFIMCAGYTDYENEDVESTLYDYGFDDNYTNFTGISIPWTTLVQSLVAKIGKENIKCHVEVLDIKRMSSTIEVKTRTRTYMCDRIILATTVHPLRKLLPEIKEYKNIESQPFLRIYGKFSKASIPILKEVVGTTTIVPGPIHKIIPMDTEKGVYMIVYTDNKGADSLRPYTENTEENRNVLCNELTKVLGLSKGELHLQSIISFYWTEGTHYYKPMTAELMSLYKTRSAFIKAAQRPYPNIFVVGEMISKKQGWVEGALESVNAIMK